MNNLLPWYKRVHRWGQTNLTEDDPEQCDLSFWKEQWKKTHVQGVIINCSGIVAYYPSKYEMQYRAAKLGDKDFYKEFNDAAREVGLTVIARMDINRCSRELYELHPDWFCRDKEGNPITSQGRYFSCVNSDYYKKYIPEVLEEIIERYGPDGFSDNSWKGLNRNTICYCDNCKKQFKEYSGQDLPEKVDWNNPIYRDWIRWSYKCRTDNWRLFNDTARKYGGEDCLWFGMMNADIEESAVSFMNLKELCAISKAVFSDHQSRRFESGFQQNSMNGSLFQLASNENIIVPESMANYVRGKRSFRLAANPMEETKMWIMEGFAGGISPWFHHISGGQHDKRQFDIPVSLFAWHAENDEYLYDRETLADVAVIWSQLNYDFYGRDQVKERCSAPWRGITQALSKARIPFMPINIDDIDKYVARINTMILPDLAIMTDKQIDTVCNYLDKGGNLILSGITGTLNEDGGKGTNKKLWEKLGLKLLDKEIGAFGDKTANWEYYDSHNYLYLPNERHEILRGFEKTDIIAFGGGFHETESTGFLKPVCGYVPAFPIYPPEFSWIREYAPEEATIFAGTIPTGSKVVYFAADIDRCYGKERLPDHLTLIRNAIEFVSDGKVLLKVEGPGYLDCNIYVQHDYNDRLVIHVVNLTACNVNPGYLDEFIPVGPINVFVPESLCKGNTAKLRVSNQKIDLTKKDRMVIITIPQIVDHEMIVIEE